jgi:hypothetical protein
MLRPGAISLYADLRRGLIPEWEKEMGNARVRLISERVISEQVAHPLVKNVPRLKELRLL